MIFKDYVKKSIYTEFFKIIDSNGYVLEHELCSLICGKYGFNKYTVIGILRKTYKEFPLCKMRMSKELKNFYGLKIKGYPIVYLPD